MEEGRREKHVHIFDVASDFRERWMRQEKGEIKNINKGGLIRERTDKERTVEEESPGLDCVCISYTM